MVVRYLAAERIVPSAGWRPGDPTVAQFVARRDNSRYDRGAGSVVLGSYPARPGADAFAGLVVTGTRLRCRGVSPKATRAPAPHAPTATHSASRNLLWDP